MKPAAAHVAAQLTGFFFSLPQILFLLDREKGVGWGKEIAAKQELQLPEEYVRQLQASFRSCSVDDATIRSTIGRVWRERRYVVDPHTSCGIVGAEQLGRAAEEEHTVVLATAHPSKFVDTVAAEVGFEPSWPWGLRFMAGHDRRQPLAYESYNVHRLAEGNEAVVEAALRQQLTRL